MTPSPLVPALPARMPVLFLAHGNPMNALHSNEFTQNWAALGQRVGKPKGIVMISAHWHTRGVGVTAMTAPETIHDFGAFPQALFDVRYPAPGSPDLARRVAEVLAPVPTAQTKAWGLDHGAWSVLVHAYPNADVPLVQLSMDASQPLAYHYATGQRLRVLRDEGILIVGSGNVVHNLGRMDWSASDAAYDWAQRFQDRVRQAISAGQDETLIDYHALGADALQAIPSADHYLPLLYVLGARDLSDDAVTFETPKLVHGSLSMMSIALWPSTWPTRPARGPRPPCSPSTSARPLGEGGVSPVPSLSSTP